MIKHFGHIIIKHTSTTKTVLHIQKAERTTVERGHKRMWNHHTWKRSHPQPGSHHGAIKAKAAQGLGGPGDLTAAHPPLSSLSDLPLLLPAREKTRLVLLLPSRHST